MKLDVAGGGAAEVGERRVEAQELLDRAGDQGRIVEQQLQLVAVLHQARASRS